jgi:hypothetical protein
MLSRKLTSHLKKKYRSELKHLKSTLAIQELIFTAEGFLINVNTLNTWKRSLKSRKRHTATEVLIIKRALQAIAIAIDELCCDLADKPHPAITAAKQADWNYFLKDLKAQTSAPPKAQPV